MRNLLKADFYRAKRDKLLLIGLIVAVALVIFQTLIIKGFTLMTDSDASSDAIASVAGATGLALWFNGISVMGNTSLYIVPIFLTIFFVKEFSDRTIRNKLIIGYSRTQIFFSILIVHAILSVIFYLATSVTGLILGGVLFGFGTVVDAGSISLLIVGFLLEFLLSYVLIGFAIIFAINKQSMVLGIIIPIVCGFVLSIFQVITLFSGETLTKVLSFTFFFQAQELQEFIDISELVHNIPIITDPELGTYYLLPLTPLARILIATPIIVVAEIVIGFLKFKKIQFK